MAHEGQGPGLGQLLCLLLAVLTLAPPAQALDALPQEARYGELEARLLVRLPHGGELRVVTEPPAEVAIAQPGVEPRAFTPAPARFDVVPRAIEDSWHGLPGTVDVVVRRSDSTHATEIFVEADDGGGAVFEWPAAAKRHWLPDVGTGLAALGIIAAAAIAWRRHGRR